MNQERQQVTLDEAQQFSQEPTQLPEQTQQQIPHYKKHLGERPRRFPKVPETPREMQRHLSGKEPHLFRDPISRPEKRKWDKFWKYGGKGFTKSIKKVRDTASSFSKRRQDAVKKKKNDRKEAARAAKESKKG